ncbi:MAG: multiple sugar transport system substrate-binding protein [Gaiellales bacterium]|jgi:multiple sugar transport system substrate-binding protein|nr:multiple sugar transport system substrate-binding protein [Gaiellales bacterium]
MAHITFLAPDTDAYVASVQRHLSEFTERTRIAVDVEIVDSDTYFSNAIHDRLAGGGADVFMSGPVLLWEHVGAGFVQPLDGFVAEAADGWDPGDFIPALLTANRWSGRFGDPLGAGPLLEIPVNCESYNLSYVPEHLERYGLDVPATWDAYFDAAEEIVRRSDGAVRGFGQRGKEAWHTMYTGYATQVWSCGGRDFDDELRCAIARPEVVAPTARFVEALRAAGPRSWTDQRWYELALDFAQGAYGLIVDSDHYVALFEDPQLSRIAGRIGYAPPPAGPDGSIVPNLWTWSLVMNARSREQPAAWRFIEWASSSEFLLRSVFEGNMNPTRTSVWDDPRLAELVSGWGDFAAVSRELVERRARVLVTPATNYIAIAERWVRALRDAYTGADGVAGALERAAADIDELTREQRDSRLP